jgi:hypothetical protein
MGTPVTIEFDHWSVEFADYIDWAAACNGVNPWRTKFGWENTTVIDECVGYPGKQRYRIFLYFFGWVQFFEKEVIFNQPNKAEPTLSPPTVVQNQDGTNRSEQTMTTKLTWNGQPLGECAQICFKEEVETGKTRAGGKYFDVLNAKLYGFPPDCVAEVKGDTKRYPNRITMKYADSTLTDYLWIDWTTEDWFYLQALKEDTVLANRTHKYTFSGRGCDGPWDLIVKFKLRFVVRKVGGVNTAVWELK